MSRRRFLPTYHYEDNTTGLLEDSVGKPLRDYKIYGNSLQNGTPTPETPVEIESVGDKTANLFDENVLSKFATALTNDEEWVIKNFAGVINDGISFKENTRYTLAFTAKQTAGNPRLIFKYTDGTSNNIGTWQLATDYTAYVGTSAANKTIAYIRMEYGSTGFTYILKGSMQLVEGVYNASTMPEYEPFGYKVPIKVTGKNLFDKNAEFDATRGVYTPTVNIDGEAVTCSHDGRFNMLYIGAWAIRTDGNTEFTVSAKNISFLSNGGYFYIREADEIPTTIDTSNMFGTQILMLAKNVNDYSYTLTTDKKYLFIICAPSNGGAVSFEELQIEYGETAMSYELYIEPQTANIYLTEPLRKVDEYTDYIDFSNGCVVRNVRCLSLDGSDDETIILQSTNSYGISNFYLDGLSDMALSEDCVMCNRLSRQTTNVANTMTEGFRFVITTSTYPYMRISSERVSTVADFRAWLSDNVVSFAYATNAPIIEPLELPPIPTIKGTTTVTADTAVRPSEVMWQYYRR